MLRMRRRIRSAALPLHRHSLPQLAVDGVLVALAYMLAYRLRFDSPSGVPGRYSDLFAATIAPVVAGSLIVFTVFRLYQKWWRYTSWRDMEAVISAVVVATLALGAYVAVASPVQIRSSFGDVSVTVPTGVLALHFLLTLAFVAGARLLARAWHERRLEGFRPQRRDARGVLIVGAGDGGRLVLREVLRNPSLKLAPLGFVDDDPRLRGMRVEGVKVLGDTGDLDRILDDAEPDEVLIAIPSAPGTLRARVARAARQRGIPVRTLPTVFELLQTGGKLVRQVREVQVEDVLGREPVRVEIDRVGAYLGGETVLVTGAGGSIGAELCRQIARVSPRRLVLVENAENALFEIRRELEEQRHFTRASAVLADCRDAVRMGEVFEEHRPGLVFHAAAYKHVPLMEENPVEAVRNNAVATRIVAAAAGDAGVKRFVLVSTDKAVSPETVMGASKALAEWAIEAAQHRFPDTRYSTVRFGNVLGSSGSVVPIFRRQIAAGGPVTVTDERMTRYFMTIPEAVQLIIRSGALADGGEIFVLEMGDPVRIVDLAHNMIKLSGHEPGRDIVIEIVGRRPGEKIHEELFNPDERPRATHAEKIMVALRDRLDPEWVESAFARVEDLVYSDDPVSVTTIVQELAAERTSIAERAR
jgi:FlaA1/EpsC-like NDP-sugar epimerase